jgi:hypothetical protein
LTFSISLFDQDLVGAQLPAAVHHGVTSLAMLARYKASSTAAFPPPITHYLLVAVEEAVASQVAQPDTPLPMNACPRTAGPG